MTPFRPLLKTSLILALSLSVIVFLTQYIMTPSSSPTSTYPNILIILDFDGTITTKDTISPLFNAALDLHTQHGRGQEMRDALKQISSSYASDLDAHSKLQGERKGGGLKTVKQLIEYQRGLRAVETRSFERVGRSGILGGIGKEAWTRIARRAVDEGGKDGVMVREGFQSFVRRLEDSGGVWKVLSVNFSESWIRGVLHTQGVDDVEIRANQPDEVGLLRGPVGEDGRRGDLVVTSDGKLAAMHQILKSARVGSSKIVYVGDSMTDVECLIQQGVIGIVMTGEDGAGKLLDTLRRVSSDEGHKYLNDIRNIKEFKDEEGKALYFAKDFSDIRDSPLFNQ